MKSISFLLMLVLALSLSCSQQKNSNKSENDNVSEVLQKHKQVASDYHNLKPEDIDLILTENFIGHGELGQTWNRENHRTWLSNGSYKRDSVYLVVAEGEWVTTMFVREMDSRGKRWKTPGMNFKKFDGNKICEIWEYWDLDYRLLDENK